MNALLASPFSGAVFLIFLFAACFFGVHIGYLAKLGWRHRRGEKQPPAPTPPPERKSEPKSEPSPRREGETAAQAPAPEPVYYIVERKKKRRKKTDEYEPPKQITFK